MEVVGNELKEEGSVLSSEDELKPGKDEEEVKPPLAIFLQCYDDDYDNDDIGGDKESEQDYHIASTSSISIKQENEKSLTQLEESKCNFQPSIVDNVISHKQETHHRYIISSSQGGLPSNLRIHPREKAYHCSECEKCFAQNSDLVMHKRVHIREKPFHCSECEKCFAVGSKLVRHMRVHTGEKPFPCGECGRCFAQNSDLVQHMRIHTGEKPFHCEHCKKGFSCKKNLVYHMRVHMQEKPF